MTQPPPPPPNQPPQGGSQPPQGGGFGAPQTPPPAGPPAPQPGYGYPQQPQQPPGAPQTPPPAGPPAPQPGYGYPGQQPNPYTVQQPGGYGQQGGYGYGYPGGPTVPMQAQQPGPASGAGGKFNAQVVIIVAAVVAIALIVGAGVWYSKTSGSDDGKNDTASSSGGTGGEDGGDEKGGTSSKGSEKVPSDPASKVLFQVPTPKVEKDDSIVVEGSWLTDDVYAKSGVAEIVGYDPAKGTKKWTIPLSGPVCQASRFMTDDNKTAVIFQPEMPDKNTSAGCSQVAAIDLTTGKKLWEETAKTGDQPIRFDNVTVSGGTVAVGSTSGGAAFDIESGKALWAPKPEDTCYDAGYGGGPKLVAVRKCGPYDQRQLHIQTIDPKSGKVISEYKMTEGIEYASVVSTDPLVVAADVGDSAGDGSGISDFFSIDNKTGKLRNRISAPGDEYAADCDGISRIEDCSGIAVGNDRLYLPTEEHDGSGESYSRTNEIVAFDLATGKQTGQRADAGDGYTITPLRMDGGNVIAYKRPPYDKGGQIVSIDGGSFKETKLLENPATESVRDVESSMLPEYAEILYSQGRLYMSDVYASASSSGEQEYLVIAFGAGV
ncbi:PQQ-binding-like beta-propeller repeat protein [Streptomyces sp. B93]|uniref:outer membrane protein assembly factor BamB family protein n=1 Tax=Streptomyces sp. B93 TaxID=2824875 RepID=UPI001B39C977|nr:PQQ-binding-like beta-propeller repeat protein [Streptomyces sp. B93]MBQ1089575.1 PQQ-binding-like beta-propeller repeat protein [Streptomyces sp. B93]